MAVTLGITHREAARLPPVELVLFHRYFRRNPPMQTLFVRYACAALTTGKRALKPHEFAPEMYPEPQKPTQGRTGRLPGLPEFFRRSLAPLLRRAED